MKNESHPKSVIAGVDFGYVNPSVIIVISIDNDDNYRVVDELYQSSLTIGELIDKARKLKEEHNIEMFFADPSQPAYIREMNNNGLYTLSAKNDMLPGINAVCEKMKIREHGTPALVIDKKCKNLIRELENYRYAERDKAVDVTSEAPLKIDDHACDALRYAIYSMKMLYKPKSFKPKWL